VVAALADAAWSVENVLRGHETCLQYLSILEKEAKQLRKAAGKKRAAAGASSSNGTGGGGSNGGAALGGQHVLDRSKGSGGGGGTAVAVKPAALKLSFREKQVRRPYATWCCCCFAGRQRSTGRGGSPRTAVRKQGLT